MYGHHVLHSNCLYIQKHLIEGIYLPKQKDADNSHLLPVELLVFQKYTIDLQNKTSNNKDIQQQ